MTQSVIPVTEKIKRVGVLSFVCLTVLIVLACPGCGIFQSKNYKVPQQWVKADRATFNVVAPTIRLLADDDPENDPDLTGVNGLAVLELIGAWEARLRAAESQMAWLKEESMFQ